MPSIEASIQAALFARAASLVLSPVHEIAWPNVAFPGLLPNGQPKPKPARYLRVTHFPNTTDSDFVSNTSTDEHKGILQITVCAPLNSGETQAREIAGLVVEHFPKGMALYRDDVKVRITKRPDCAAKITTDTEIQIPVSIRYEALV